MERWASPDVRLGTGARRAALALVAAAAAFASGLVLAAPARAGNERAVVVLLFDGFAPSMLELAATPALDRMREEGAWSHGMTSAFPTISLINGVTVSTGCWPEHHGIVSNLFLDPERGLYDHSSDADWLSGCEHLHQAAERQGVRSAAIGWYGAESGTRGPLASVIGEEKRHCGPTLESSIAYDAARADQLVDVVARGPDGPRLVLGYFCGPDGVAHFRGLDSPDLPGEVARADAIVARVMAAIEARPDAERVALLVTTDHGMREASHLVNIQRILKSEGIDANPVSSGTTSFLYFQEKGETAADLDARVAAAAEALSDYDEFEVLVRGEFPEWAHLGNGPRVGRLIVSAHPPYFIEDAEAWPSWLRWLGDWGPKFVWARFSLKAHHGYPPQVEGMDGILYAWGAGIARGRRVPETRNIDIHPTAAHLLGIAPGRPVDGTIDRNLLNEAHQGTQEGPSP